MTTESSEPQRFAEYAHGEAASLGGVMGHAAWSASDPKTWAGQDRNWALASGNLRVVRGNTVDTSPETELTNTMTDSTNDSIPESLVYLYRALKANAHDSRMAAGHGRPSSQRVAASFAEGRLNGLVMAVKELLNMDFAFQAEDALEEAATSLQAPPHARLSPGGRS